jgi:hypothetical protein
MNNRRRILFVAMPSSIHVARWVERIAHLGWDLHLFPVANEPPHENLAGVTIHWPMAPLRPRLLLRMLRRDPLKALNPFTVERRLYPNVTHRTILKVPMVKLSGLLPPSPYPPAEARLADAFGPLTLSLLIRRLRPDLVHSMEFQHAGYRALRAKEMLGAAFPPWLATNWGSDIFLYRHQERHRATIRRLLGSIDLYSCECERDVALARELGLTAPVLPVFPNSGGFDLDKIAALRTPGPIAARRLLMVKGYQHFAGRAMTALDAVERCRDALAGYDILVFSGSADVKARVRNMAEQGCPIYAPDYLSHTEMLRAFGRARAYLGVSLSDAIASSLLEAMAMGAFPIQTNTSCCEEWIEDGISGFAIPADDLDTITARLRRALTDDSLVDRAAAINAATVRDRLEAGMLRQCTRAFYDEAFALTAARRAA